MWCTPVVSVRAQRQVTEVRHDRSQSPAQQMKVMAMTTTQPRYPFTRWIDAPLAAIRHLNDELTGAGEALACSNRFPQTRAPRPQPRPQAGLAAAKRAAWA
jgi:hypothetical protein